MFGNNPIRGLEKGDGSTLQIQSMFATFQGEGPFVGWASVFIRLGGCNLACLFCDTEFETFSPLSLEAILEKTQALSLDSHGKRIRHLIVITGGEPFRQPIAPLCEKLLADGFQVQIETNGTLFRPLPPEVSIICSPKAPQGKYFPLHPELLSRITALKFIVSAENLGYNSVPELGQGVYGIPVYVQPMDEYIPEKNQANMALAVRLAMDYGYRFSLQVHKIANVE